VTETARKSEPHQRARVDVSSTIDPDPLSQYVYHPYYVDAIALRYYDSDTSGGGTYNTNIYLQDANFNVTAVVDDFDTTIERRDLPPWVTPMFKLC